LRSINPGDFLRLKTGDNRIYYKLIVNARGIHLRKARLFEKLGAMLGTDISHPAAIGEHVTVFGLEFRITDGESQPELLAVD